MFAHNMDSLINVKKQTKQCFFASYCTFTSLNYYYFIIINNYFFMKDTIYLLLLQCAPHFVQYSLSLCFHLSLHPVSSIIHKLMARQWGVSCQCLLKDTAAVAAGEMEVTGICNYFCCEGFVGWASGCGPVEQNSRSVTCLSKLWEASVQQPPTETFQTSLVLFGRWSFCWLL